MASAEVGSPSASAGDDLISRIDVEHAAGKVSEPEDRPVPKGRVSSASDAPMVWMDFMRSLACVLVVLGHCTVNTRDLPLKNIDRVSWDASILYTVIARPAVPLFFMMSGYLLLHRVSEHYMEHYRKRLPSIVNTMIARSLIYLAIRSYRSEKGWLTFDDWVRILLFEFPAEHLWFLYSMFGYYIALPLFRPMVRLEERLLLLMVLVWLITDPLAASLHKFQGVVVPLFGLMGFPRFGYFLIGALFRLHPTFNRRVLTWCTAVYVVGSAIMFFGTLSVSSEKGRLWDGYTAQTGVFLAVVTTAMFPVLRAIGQLPFVTESVLLRSVCAALSEHSYGIYLSHIAFVTYFSGVIDPYSMNGVYRMPMLTVMVLICSFALTDFLKRIPYIRGIVL